MIALALLLAAAAVLHWGGSDTAALLGAVALAAAAGTTLPDIDQVLPLGGHRSALSHSVLPACLCLRRRWWPVAAGLALGLGLHLAADVFPRSMRGFATVKLPFAGGMGAGASRAWLALNMAAALVLAVALGRALMPGGPARWAAAALAGLAGLLYLMRVPGGVQAMLLLGACGWLALSARRHLGG
ncbi:hypothetical protein [Sphingomonas jatrophae]|uniref:Uncharacterized protein n=1 Tax=Sphingomonas jatrophae TaxID=1166337 RepID=A0A1I6KYD4_9SPHN|nr:hypothetical protein [Sphingomonas jatrophae]SFR96246.1 hypothetical protein SAMN05192580_1957 [Sphingomonas jatrophae]